MRSNQALPTVPVRPLFPPAGTHRRRGSALQWVGMCTPVVAAFASLIVDWGRVQLVRAQLQFTAEAAARHATNSLCGNPSVVRAAAKDVALENRADGQPVVLTDEDIELGTWDPNTGRFRVLTGYAESTADAVRITARRTSARGTGVPAIFAQLAGHPSTDVTATATTTLGIEGFGVIGLNYVKMGGNSTASWDPNAGVLSTGAWGNVASNGNISLSGSSYINGHARPGINSYCYGADGRVSGTVRQLKTPLVFADGDAGTAATYNNNASVPTSYRSGQTLSLDSNDKLSLPGGTYYFQDVLIFGTLTFTGPTTIYCYGTFDLHGKAITAANLPKNLSIIMCPAPDGSAPGTVKVWSTSALRASIYAPQSPVLLGGTGDIYGSILGKSIDMSGTSAIYYDVSLKAHGTSVSLVR